MERQARAAIGRQPPMLVREPSSRNVTGRQAPKSAWHGLPPPGRPAAANLPGGQIWRGIRCLLLFLPAACWCPAVSALQRVPALCLGPSR